MNLKPALAEDATLDKVTYPCWVQPEIDGVRALKPGPQLTGRSLDPFKGYGVTEAFSLPEYTGFDGEMTLGDMPNSAERLCSLTTGAIGAFKGVTEVADLHWWLFDLVLPSTITLPTTSATACCNKHSLKQRKSPACTLCLTRPALTASSWKLPSLPTPKLGTRAPYFAILQLFTKKVEPLSKAKKSGVSRHGWIARC